MGFAAGETCRSASVRTGGVGQHQKWQTTGQRNKRRGRSRGDEKGGELIVLVENPAGVSCRECGQIPLPRVQAVGGTGPIRPPRFEPD